MNSSTCVCPYLFSVPKMILFLTASNRMPGTYPSLDDQLFVVCTIETGSESVSASVMRQDNFTSEMELIHGERGNSHLLKNCQVVGLVRGQRHSPFKSLRQRPRDCEQLSRVIRLCKTETKTQCTKISACA